MAYFPFSFSSTGLQRRTLPSQLISAWSLVLPWLEMEAGRNFSLPGCLGEDIQSFTVGRSRYILLDLPQWASWALLSSLAIPTAALVSPLLVLFKKAMPIQIHSPEPTHNWEKGKTLHVSASGLIPLYRNISIPSLRKPS